jgi:predicted O-methyltransferase YrrM
MNDLGDPILQGRLQQLHEASKRQETLIEAYFTSRGEGVNWAALDDDAHQFLADKLVALDPDKGFFCYQLCLALRAKRVIEVGTSHGVSTLYLAHAMKALEAGDGERGRIIATEYEPRKAAAARANFASVGLDRYIELREGDLRETLQRIEAPIDFVLMDIWEMARPAIELITPHLRRGAIVIADNTADFDESYAAYFDYVRNPINAFTTQTLPFGGGLEMTVKI